jgi:D-inositol-3-phosphate glycosyltransferase
MTARRRVLVVGDGCAPTGFGRVLHAIFGRLRARWDVHHLMLNHLCAPPWHDWQAHGSDIEGDPGGFEKLRRLARALDPEAVLILHDARLVGLYLDCLREAGCRARKVAYCPLEGRILRPQAIRRLCLADALVTFTPFALGALQAAERELAKSDPGFRLPPLAIVPHGVDRDRFFRTPGGRAAARQALFPDLPSGAFVVLNANRNQPRKRIDLTIQGFAAFAGSAPEARLCLHMGLKDHGVDLRAFAAREGILDRLLLTARGDGLPAYSDAELNLVYNACDVGLNTSMGEGWGLVSFEHGATGAAQVVPRHSACAELWENKALLVDTTAAPSSSFDYMEKRSVAPADVAAALARLHEDAALREELSRAAEAHARSPEHDWDAISARLEALLGDDDGALPARGIHRRRGAYRPTCASRFPPPDATSCAPPASPSPRSSR